MATLMTDPRVGIRPFRVDIPAEQIDDLRRRPGTTRWPERETVNDDTRGVQLTTIQALAHYWAKDYDWRPCEARLNAQPALFSEEMRTTFRSLR